MKKFLLASFLSLASAALWAAASQAGAFGLIPDYCCPFHHGCCGGCCNKCCTTICIKPYNAFSTCCCGNMTYDGCCPCMGGMPGCGFGGCAPQGCCPSMGCAPSCTSLPSCGAPEESCSSPCGSPAVSPAPPLAPPAPAVLPVPANNGMGMRAMPQQAAPVQPAVYHQVNAYNYAPMLPPTVAPMGYQPWYWAPGGYGR